MKIIFLQGLAGGLLGRLSKLELKGLLKPRLNGLFARTPVLAVLLLTAVVAACGGPKSSGPAPSSNQPPVSNQAPVFSAGNSPGVQFTPANGTTPANYIFANIPLNLPAGNLVGDVSATDANNDAISYNISGGDDDNALFKINATTGEINLKAAAANGGDYLFNATASDGKGGSTIATISVSVDDTPPVFTGTPYNFDLSLVEANAARIVVGRVSATDEQGTAFNYRLEGNSDLFRLTSADNADGIRSIITTRAATLSDFAVPSITFQVVATHQGGGLSSNADVRVTLISDSDADGFNDFYDADPNDENVNVTGSGNSSHPYIISNIYQLQAIAGVDHNGTMLDSSNFTNNGFLYGTDAAEQLTKHYILANDIDASATADATVWNKLEVGDSSDLESSSAVEGSIEGSGWTPIAGKRGQSFSGSFSGEGYAINSLTSILRQGDNSKHFGLFGMNNGNITALRLQNVDINIEAPMGTYTKSTTVDNIISGSHAGGLVGLNQEDGIISYSYTTGDVNASMDAIGGLVGLNEGEISYSYSTAAVLGEGDTGGLVGANEGGAILSSYTAGGVDGGVGIVGRNGTTGGLAGSISGEGAIINSSYAIRNVNDVTMPRGSLGGVVAERGNDVTIEFTYWDKFDDDILAVGQERVDVTQPGDIDGTTELNLFQFQGCELDGMVIAGVDPGLDCSVFFPSSHWGNSTKDGVTRGWIFNANQYPTLSAVRSSDNKQLLPSAADQECQRTFSSSFC